MRSILFIIVGAVWACSEPPSARRSTAAEAQPSPVPQPVGSVDAAVSERRAQPGWGTAAYFMTNVFAGPTFDSKRIGWVRVGQHVDIGPRSSPGDDECPEGFYPLTKTRGFVCAGKGIVVGRNPRSVRLGAHPADLSAPVPYQYGYVREDETALYRRMPTREQVLEIEGPTTPVNAADAAVPDGGPTAQSGETTEAEPPEQGALPDPVEEQDEEEEELDTHGGLVLRYLKKGFMLSMDRPAGEWPNLLYRTIRGQYVNARRIHMMRVATFRGIALGPDESLPVAFATGRARVRFERTSKGRIAAKKRVDRNLGFRVVGELEERRTRYLQAPDGALYRSDAMRVVRSVPIPEGVGPREKWIDVDLVQQALTAYEGARPVYATLISSGLERAEHATPPGSFRIRSKHVTFTMDGDLEGDGAYSIEDVPYVMYYDLSYALHGAFWHSYYGWQRSHGCVNLSAEDARWLFAWVEPVLPDGWYGVWADEEHPGTRVFIRAEGDESRKQ